MKKDELLFFWQVVDNGIGRVDGVVFLSETSDGVSARGDGKDSRDDIRILPLTSHLSRRISK